MNYEELIEARNDSRKKRQWLPLGEYYRHQVDGKWRCVIDVHQHLQRDNAFSKALDEEVEKNHTLANRHQIHFEAVKEQGDVRQLDMEQGNFLTFSQLLQDNPAVVAKKNFLDLTLESLVDITEYLHKQGIWHVCYSPATVFCRRGDEALMLASHGSFYLGLRDQRSFYGSEADYVAPEVLDGGTVDGRCDVYGIGKFLTSLCDQSDIPFEYRKALKKATSAAPDERFATPVDMLKAVRKLRSTYHSVLTFIGAAVIAALCIGLYFEMVPETQPIEFVKPAPRQATDDLLDDGVTPAELGVASDGDSLVPDKNMERAFQAKAEEIFRKRYEKEADRILSKIYNNKYMSNSEKKFRTESESTINELMVLQNELGSDAGLTPERSQLVASEIIERITNKKKSEMNTNSRGVKLPEKKK